MTLAKLKLAAATGAAAIAVAATAIAVEKIVAENAAQPAGIATAASDTVQSEATVITTAQPAEIAVRTATTAVAEKTSSTQPQSTEIDDSAWSNLNTAVFGTLPPTFILRPTHFSAEKSGIVSTININNGVQETKMLARAITFQALLSAAYSVPRSRVIFSEGMPEEKVDVLLNTPGASLETLQDAIKKQYGLGTTREMREGDALVVKVKNTDAPGLKPSQEGDSRLASAVAGGFSVGGGFAGGGGTSSTMTVVNSTRIAGTNHGEGDSAQYRTAIMIGRNSYNAQGQTIAGLLQQLQRNFEMPLDDETGLSGTYDISLKWELPSDGTKAGDAIKAAMLEQLGLELTPDRAQIEMLVVRKVE